MVVDLWGSIWGSLRSSPVDHSWFREVLIGPRVFRTTGDFCADMQWEDHNSS